MRFAPVKTMVLSAGLALLAGAANAAIITGTYAVTGSNFVSTGTTSPFASITESFTITFDNTVLVSGQTTGISLNASTVTPTSALAFTYIPGADFLTVGGTAATVATADPSSTDFALVLRNASSPTNFSITSLSYSTGQGSVYTALTTARATPTPTATPEPASLAILGGAVAAIGLVRRRKAR